MDALVPLTSRFPLSLAGGAVPVHPDAPSGADTRPFGMRFAVRPVEAGRHSKRPTRLTRLEETEYTDDTQQKIKTDHIPYIEWDEE